MRHNQYQLLKTLEAVRFSGQFIQTDAAGQQWIFYLSQGAIVHVAGGTHPVRRWRRNVALHCPRMAMHRFTWYGHLASASPAALAIGWEYALLNQWISRQDITREQATKLVQAIAVEALFEIALAADVTEQTRHGSSLSTEWGTVSIEAAIAETQGRWQSWQAANLALYSPNKSPIIRQPEPLQKRSPALYQTLNAVLNGQHTLYDLATQMKRGVVEVTASLLPCIQMGWVELINLPDFPVPTLRQDVPKTPVMLAAPKGAVIACVDDSSLVRQMMEELLTSAGYQFVGISDPLRAIGVLLARKPDLIFLDLMMPNASGHEVCQQLRKLTYFRHTPIVILTGSDGYANRLRSSFVGASEFLTKPLDAEEVLTVIRKYLEQGATHLSVSNNR